MAVTFDTKWPAALTNAAWQKKKSVADKVKGKSKPTGLGAALTKAQTAWGLIKFNTLDARKVAIPTAKEADNAKERAETHYTTVVKPASAAILTAAKTAAVVKVNKDLSKTAQQAAGEIEKGLLKLARSLRDIDFDDFDDVKQQVVLMHFQTKSVGLVQSVARGRQLIKQVESAKDAKTAAQLLSSNIIKASRDITQNADNLGAINNKPDPKKLADPLRDWNNINSVSIDEGEVKDTLKKLKKAVTDLERWLA